MSIVAPIWALFTFAFVDHKSLLDALHEIPISFRIAFGLLWAGGVALVVILYCHYQKKDRLVNAK